MRSVEVVGSLAPLVGVGVGVWMAFRRRLVRHYESQAAFGPGSAVTPPAARFPATRWWRRRLSAAGVIGASPDGREWLDAARWASYRSSRRRRALSVVLALLFLLLLVAWLAARR